MKRHYEGGYILRQLILLEAFLREGALAALFKKRAAVVSPFTGAPERPLRRAA